MEEASDVCWRSKKGWVPFRTIASQCACRILDRPWERIQGSPGQSNHEALCSKQLASVVHENKINSGKCVANTQTSGRCCSQQALVTRPTAFGAWRAHTMGAKCKRSAVHALPKMKMKMKMDQDEDEDRWWWWSKLEILKTQNASNLLKFAHTASGLLHQDKKSLFVCLLHCCVDLHVFSLEKPCTDNSAESQLLTVAEDIWTDWKFEAYWQIRALSWCLIRQKNQESQHAFLMARLRGPEVPTIQSFALASSEGVDDSHLAVCIIW